MQRLSKGASEAPRGEHRTKQDRFELRVHSDLSGSGLVATFSHLEQRVRSEHRLTLRASSHAYGCHSLPKKAQLRLTGAILIMSPLKLLPHPPYSGVLHTGQCLLRSGSPPAASSRLANDAGSPSSSS